MIMDLKIKCKTTKLLEKDTGKILWDLGLVEEFLDLGIPWQSSG